MPTTTPNLGLTKPLLTEDADVDVFNTNMDLIDTKFGEGVDIADDSITEPKFADDSVSNRAIAPNAVTNTEIAGKTIDIATKLNSEIVTYTSDLTAGTDDGVPHTLGRIPTGYIVINKDKPASVYKGVTSWSNTSIFLRSNTSATVVTVLIF